jgi:hypothetical protein
VRSRLLPHVSVRIASGPAIEDVAKALGYGRLAPDHTAGQAKRSGQDTWGNAEWDPQGKTGTISVLDPADYNLRGAELKLDMECTIVHELVHIQVGPFDAPNEGVREDVVNRIMTALLNRACPN